MPNVIASSKLSACSCSVMGFHKLHVLSFFIAQLPLLCLIYSSNTAASKNQNGQISNIDKMMARCLMFASSLKRSNVTKAEPPTSLCTMPFCNSIVDASCSFPVNLVQRLTPSVIICIWPVALLSLTGQVPVSVIFSTCTFVRVSFACLAPVFVPERGLCCEASVSSCRGNHMVLGTAGTDQSCSVVAETLSSEKCTVCPKCARLVAGLVQSAVWGARSISLLSRVHNFTCERTFSGGFVLDTSGNKNKERMGSLMVA